MCDAIGKMSRQTQLLVQATYFEWACVELLRGIKDRVQGF